MIVVTGGAGFIGSNLVKQLNRIGERQIIVVDDLTDGTKFINFSDCNIADYIDKDDFLQLVQQNKLPAVKAILHQGACSETTEWNGKYMMENNYQYSKHLLNYALKNKIQFIYASSAAVYGGNTTFKEEPVNEAPLNVYGYSKLLFDQYVRQNVPATSSQVVGLRYFNVYGPKEQHKDKMASVAFHFNNQIKENGVVKLFAGTDGYADGEQLRDFVYIDDIANLVLWFLKNPSINGIFNAGTGKSQSFNDVANAVIAYHQRGSIEYIPFPEHLKGRYQSFTEADISSLRAVGYDQSFRDVAAGVQAYLQQLNNK